MSRTLVRQPISSRHFFSAFHRYVALTSSPPTRHHRTHRQIQTTPLPRSIHSNRHQFPPSTKPSIPLQRPISTGPSATSSPPLPRHTHYALFPLSLPHGPPPSGPFTPNLRALRQEYLRLQAVAHPDVSRSSADGGAKARAEAHSAGINEAYKTLCDPLRRAEYLLELRGSDQRASSRDTERIESADHTAPFLSTIMEIRESIEAATEMSEIEMLKRENEERIEHSVRVLEEAFERDEVGRAKSEVERLRYWVSIREGLEGWEGRN